MFEKFLSTRISLVSKRRIQALQGASPLTESATQRVAPVHALGQQSSELLESSTRNLVASIASAPQVAETASAAPVLTPAVGAAVAGGALALYGLKKLYDTPSRTYDGEPITCRLHRVLGL